MTTETKSTAAQPRTASTEESREQQMNSSMRASVAASKAEEAQEERRRVAAQVQNDAAEKQGVEVVYKKDEK